MGKVDIKMEDFFKALLEAPVQTILIVCGIAFFLLAFFRKIGAAEVDRQPNLWALVIGVVLLLLGISLLYSKTSPSTIQNFPFEAKVYNFEKSNDETNDVFWFAVPKSKFYKTEISQDFAHSGKRSLRLFVDMQAASANPDTEYAGLGLVEKVPLQAKAIAAWVLIPESEPIQNISFKAHILAYVYKAGENLVFMGEETQIQPGIWTPLYIGTFGETKYASSHIVWNGKVDELYLTIWSDKPYNGSMYIDDLSIYGQ